jgi:hypothetical protein
LTTFRQRGTSAAINRRSSSGLLIENGVKPGSNVYAELGSTWRFLMRDPEQAAHALGKLIKYCGKDNVLWGTDSIWYASPQDQIHAFRVFQISEQLRAKRGYPEITPAIRAKIFGLNGATVYGLSAAEVKKYASRDELAREKSNYLENPILPFRTYGPKNPPRISESPRPRRTVTRRTEVIFQESSQNRGG